MNLSTIQLTNSSEIFEGAHT